MYLWFPRLVSDNDCGLEMTFSRLLWSITLYLEKKLSDENFPIQILDFTKLSTRKTIAWHKTMQLKNKHCNIIVIISLHFINSTILCPCFAIIWAISHFQTLSGDLPMLVETTQLLIRHAQVSQKVENRHKKREKMRCFKRVKLWEMFCFNDYLVIARNSRQNTIRSFGFFMMKIHSIIFSQKVVGYHVVSV